MLHPQEEAAPRFGFAHFEGRRHPRFSVICPLEYWQINTSKNLSGRTADVSEGGLLLCIPDTVEVGQKLRLKLFIGDLLALKSIEAIGEVVWKDLHFGEKDEYRMGVKFIEISPGDMEEIEIFLENLFKLKPPSQIQHSG
jgi:c-di-GMP-binding flagellar brake protein YcgR